MTSHRTVSPSLRLQRPRLCRAAVYLVTVCWGVLAALLVTGAPANAQVAELAADLNPDEHFNSVSSRSLGYQRLGDRVVFFAGLENLPGHLWATRGTPETTEALVSAISPAVAEMGGLLYFLSWETPAYTNSRDLWRTDGTREGTFPLLEAAGTAGYLTPSLAFGEVLLFATGTDLWQTDGTVAGTEAVAAVEDVRRIVPYGEDRALLISPQGFSITDGTPAGTRLLAEATASDEKAVASGSKIFFASEDPPGNSFRPVLRVFPTLEASPILVPLPAGLEADARSLVAGEAGSIVFRANDDDHGAQLWTADGTDGGTRRITDAPEDSAGIGGFWTDGGTTWFVSFDNTLDGRLLRVEGTPESQVEIFPRCDEQGCEADSDGVLRFGDHFYIEGTRGAGAGPRAWISDGTLGDLRTISDLCGPQCTDGVVLPEVSGDRLRFFGFSSTGQGTLFYSTDGTRVGTELITPPGLGLGPERTDVARLPSGAWVLQLGLAGEGREPWVSSPDPAATRMLVSIGQEAQGSQLGSLGDGGGHLVFTAKPESAGSVEAFRLAEDGTAVQVADLNAHPDDELFFVNGVVYLVEEGQTDHDLWALGDDEAESQVLVTLGGELTPLLPWQGGTYFTVYDGQDLGLWQTDGTTAGTRRVFDPAGEELFGFSRLVPGPEHLYFVTVTLGGLLTLRRSDGTAAGTEALGPLADFYFSGIDRVRLSEAVEAGGSTYFLFCRASSQTAWKLPGGSGPPELLGDAGSCRPEEAQSPLLARGAQLLFTSGGLRQPTGVWTLDTSTDSVSQLRVGEQPFYHFTETLPFGDRLLFTFSPGGGDHELWVTDGTESGTHAVRDVAPGYLFSAPRRFTPAGGLVYFAARTPGHGEELWVTDGTEDGTRLVHDVYPGPLGSSPEHLTVVDDRLYFAADDGLVGRELWVLPLGGGPACRASEKALCLQGGRFRTEARWKDFRDRRGTGQAVPLTEDTGYFWFFNEQNVETVLKVLDGRANNDHFWSFYGALSNVQYWLTVTDTETGLTRRYFNPPRSFASVGDTFSFGPQGASLRSSPDLLEARPSPLPEVIRSQATSGTATGTCAPSSERLCVNGGRFAVEVDWQKPNGETGTGKAVDLTDDTGYFWFFRETNVELILKVLDGTANNGNYWVFYGSLSNVNFDVTVTDTMTGEVRTYLNRGREFASVGDTEAFEVP